MPRSQSALGVIKSTAVWLQQLNSECVMYFNNDSARRQTGLSSRSLSQLIPLLLTTLMGRESSPAACHFSKEGGDEGGDGCVCVHAHFYTSQVLIVILCACM